LDIISFDGGDSKLEYIIPIKPDFSKVMLVEVSNPGPLFDQVLSTLKLIN